MNFPLNKIATLCLTVAVTLMGHAADEAASQPAGLDAETRALLTEVQRAGVRYFYEFGHPVSGLAREGSQRSPELCGTGNTGWGCFNLIVAAERGFVPRADVAARAQTILRFLATKADRFHGAFPHWLNGETGKTIPFSREDDGADLVETAFLIQGVLALREYFTGDNATERDIRALADQLWRDVDWTWFAREEDGHATLVWHWSPRFNWQEGPVVEGFNETQIVYLLALGSPTHPLPARYYWSGWQGGGVRFSTPREDLGIPATLGHGMWMPLFFAHYSYIGFDPHALSVEGHTYFEQLRDLCRVQVAYAQSKTGVFTGYGPLWGLTACYGPHGYLVHAPGRTDDGTLAPTAALSSMPYVPEASLACLRELQQHYRARLWGPYGFADAFNLTEDWVERGYLGGDVGPIAPMIENYLSGLCWRTFMKAPEIAVALQRVRESEPKRVAAEKVKVEK